MLVRQVLARLRPAVRRLGPTREVRRERHFFEALFKSPYLQWMAY